MTRSVIAALLLALALAGCNRQAEPELTTTTTTVGGEGAATTTTTSSEEAPEEDGPRGGEASDESPPEAEPIEDYDVVVRSSTEGGEVLWVTVPPGDHGQVPLEGLVATIVDETEAPVWELHVFDDPEALEAGRVPPAERSEEQQALVEAHYLVSLSEGNVVRFQGPYADLGEFVLGS